MFLGAGGEPPLSRIRSRVDDVIRALGDRDGVSGQGSLGRTNSLRFRDSREDLRKEEAAVVSEELVV